MQFLIPVSIERATVRFGIIADIHANLEALELALDVLKKEGVDQIIALGDIVGYNANPKECLELIINNEIPSIRGNHERYIIGEIHESVKGDTIKVIEWTREQLSKDNREFIEQMPNKMRHEMGFLITHGSPRNKDEYLLKLNSFVANLKLLEEKYSDANICFHGHTHLPSVVGKGHIVQNIQEDRTIKLDDGKQYLINPGSLGQPRDQCPLSSFGIFDEQEYSFTFFRRKYDVEKAHKKVLDLGISKRFADRLLRGTQKSNFKKMEEKRWQN